VGVGLPQRVGGLLDDASHLISSVGEVVAAARETATGAHQVVCEAATTSRSAAELVALWEPLARDAAPLAQRFVDDLSGAEVNAAIKLVDQLPLFTEAMQADIMPILQTLDKVAPDLQELLDVAKQVRRAIDGVPGSGYFRKRGEAKDDARDDQHSGNGTGPG